MAPVGDPDLIRVQQDALFVDALARRADLTAFADEPLAARLAAFVADVDRDDLAPRPHLVVGEGWVQESWPEPVPFDRRRRAAVVALTVGAVLLGSSGVAAAVTGDPLAPLRGAVNLVTGAGSASDGSGSDGSGSDGPTAAPGTGTPSQPGQGVGRDGQLPDTAALEGRLNRSLNRVAQLAAQGQYDRARALLVTVESTLADAPAAVASSFAHRVDALAAMIDRAEARGTHGAAGTGGRPSDHAGGQAGSAPADPSATSSAPGSGGSTAGRGSGRVTGKQSESTDGTPDGGPGAGHGGGSDG